MIVYAVFSLLISFSSSHLHHRYVAVPQPGLPLVVAAVAAVAAVVAVESAAYQADSRDLAVAPHHWDEDVAGRAVGHLGRLQEYSSPTAAQAAAQAGSCEAPGCVAADQDAVVVEHGAVGAAASTRDVIADVGVQAACAVADAVPEAAVGTCDALFEAVLFEPHEICAIVHAAIHVPGEVPGFLSYADTRGR